MKRSMMKMIAAVAVATIMTGGTGYAQATAPDAKNHEAHHSEGQAAPTTTAEKPMEGGMMGSMKMDDMQGMMHDCMKMHKDHKTCHQESMKSCEAKMGKEECSKMMKKMKHMKMDKK